jgi:hypothetical protein
LAKECCDNENEAAMQNDPKPKSSFDVTAMVVGFAFLLIIVIILYLHFDAAITKFWETSKAKTKEAIVTVKRKLRKKLTPKQKVKIKARVLNKIRVMGALRVASLEYQKKTKEAAEAAGISVISNGQVTMNGQHKVGIELEGGQNDNAAAAVIGNADRKVVQSATNTVITAMNVEMLENKSTTDTDIDVDQLEAELFASQKGLQTKI